MKLLPLAAIAALSLSVAACGGDENTAPDPVTNPPVVVDETGEEDCTPTGNVEAGAGTECK